MRLRAQVSEPLGQFAGLHALLGRDQIAFHQVLRAYCALLRQRVVGAHEHAPGVGYGEAQHVELRVVLHLAFEHHVEVALDQAFLQIGGGAA